MNQQYHKMPLVGPRQRSSSKQNLNNTFDEPFKIIKHYNTNDLSFQKYIKKWFNRIVVKNQKVTKDEIIGCKNLIKNKKNRQKSSCTHLKEIFFPLIKLLTETMRMNMNDVCSIMQQNGLSLCDMKNYNDHWNRNWNKYIFNSSSKDEKQNQIIKNTYHVFSRYFCIDYNFILSIGREISKLITFCYEYISVKDVSLNNLQKQIKECFFENFTKNQNHYPPKTILKLMPFSEKYKFVFLEKEDIVTRSNMVQFSSQPYFQQFTIFIKPDSFQEMKKYVLTIDITQRKEGMHYLLQDKEEIKSIKFPEILASVNQENNYESILQRAKQTELNVENADDEDNWEDIERFETQNNIYQDKALSAIPEHIRMHLPKDKLQELKKKMKLTSNVQVTVKHNKMSIEQYLKKSNQEKSKYIIVNKQKVNPEISQVQEKINQYQIKAEQATKNHKNSSLFQDIDYFDKIRQLSKSDLQDINCFEAFQRKSSQSEEKNGNDTLLKEKRLQSFEQYSNINYNKMIKNINHKKKDDEQNSLEKDTCCTQQQEEQKVNTIVNNMIEKKQSFKLKEERLKLQKYRVQLEKQKQDLLREVEKFKKQKDKEEFLLKMLKDDGHNGYCCHFGRKRKMLKNLSHNDKEEENSSQTKLSESQEKTSQKKKKKKNKNKKSKKQIQTLQQFIENEEDEKIQEQQGRLTNFLSQLCIDDMNRVACNVQQNYLQRWKTRLTPKKPKREKTVEKKKKKGKKNKN